MSLTYLRIDFINKNVRRMAFLKAILATLVFLSACIPQETARSRPPVSQVAEAPVYDIFGFPVGIKYQFLPEDGHYKDGFELALTELPGIWCGGSVAEEARTVYMHQTAFSRFSEMAIAAKKIGITLEVCSAYRGHKFQIKIQQIYPHRAAPPGFSEHHLGTAIDLHNVRWNTAAYTWLTENAHHFGFILSYFRGHQIFGFPEEANHWRFIGIEPAKTYFEIFKPHY